MWSLVLGPSPGLELVHGGVVAVLVLDGVFVEASGEEGLLLGVYGELFGRVAFELVAVLVDRPPVEGGVHVLEDEAAFALAGARIAGVVGVLGVGVEAAGAALQGVAGLDVHAAAARAAEPGAGACTCCAAGGAGALLCAEPGLRAARGAGGVGVAGVDALDGDFGALAAVGCGVDGDRGGDGAGGRLLPVGGAVGEDLDAVVDQRLWIAVLLQDRKLDDAVIEGPTVAVVGEGDGVVDLDLGDFGEGMGGGLAGGLGD
jgi:hypothetical protein